MVATDDDVRFAAIQAYLEAVEQFAGVRMVPAMFAYAAPPLLRICLDLGERGWAKAVAEQAAAVVPDPGEPALLRAMILDDAGRPERARAALEPVLRGAASCHVVTTAVHARVLAAEIEVRRDASARAHELIVEAVEVAAAEEVARPLLERRSCASY